jgi:hypothetical protein
MIDALVTGKLYGQPEQRTSKNGKAFVVGKLLVSMGTEERVFASLIAFDENSCRALLALSEGETAAVSGELRFNLYQAKDGSTRILLDCTVHAVLTTYHVRRKRQAMEEGPDDGLSIAAAMRRGI